MEEHMQTRYYEANCSRDELFHVIKNAPGRTDAPTPYRFSPFAAKQIDENNLKLIFTALQETKTFSFKFTSDKKFQIKANQNNLEHFGYHAAIGIGICSIFVLVILMINVITPLGLQSEFKFLIAGTVGVFVSPLFWISARSAGNRVWKKIEKPLIDGGYCKRIDKI